MPASRSPCRSCRRRVGADFVPLGCAVRRTLPGGVAEDGGEIILDVGARELLIASGNSRLAGESEGKRNGPWSLWRESLYLSINPC